MIEEVFENKEPYEVKGEDHKCEVCLDSYVLWNGKRFIYCTCEKGREKFLIDTQDKLSLVGKHPEPQMESLDDYTEYKPYIDEYTGLSEEDYD